MRWSILLDGKSSKNSKRTTRWSKENAILEEIKVENLPELKNESLD